MAKSTSRTLVLPVVSKYFQQIKARRVKRRWVGMIKVPGLVHEHFDSKPTDVFAVDVTGEDVAYER